MKAADTSANRPRHLSLHQRQSSWLPALVSLFMLCASFGLLVYAHVGTSAEVLINTQLSTSTAGCATPGDDGNSTAGNGTDNGTATALCVATDVAVWNSMGSSASLMLTACATDCGAQTLSSPACVVSCVKKRGFSDGCSTCFGNVSKCAVTQCLAQCLSSNTASCGTCTLTKCYSSGPSCNDMMMGVSAIAASPSPSPSLAPAIIKPSPSPATTNAGQCGAVDVAVWNAMGPANTSVVLSGCVSGCGLQILSGPTCVVGCVKAKGFSDGCSTCFGNVSACAVARCANECAGSNTALCASCTLTTCYSSGPTCSSLMLSLSAAASSPSLSPSPSPTSVAGQCVAADTAVWNAMGPANSSVVMSSCVSSCIPQMSSGPACVVSCVKAKGFSDGCSACFGNVSMCAMTQCLTQCTGGNMALCAGCTLTTCYSSGPTCSDLMIGGGSNPSPSPALPAPSSSPTGSAQCGAADVAVWSAMGPAAGAMLTTCATGCGVQLLTGPACAVTCVKAKGFSDNCSACFGALSTCAASKCLTECISGNTSLCGSCTLASCYTSGPSCAGLMMSLSAAVASPSPSPRPAASPSPTTATTTTPGTTTSSSSKGQYYVVGHLSFVGSVKSAWRSGAVALGFFVMLLSCAWPYSKLVLLCIAWFCPMSPVLCRRIVLFTNIFGRLGLCDIFVVSILMAGANLKLAGGMLHLATESRPSVHTLVIAGVLCVLLGEWMMHCLRVTTDREEGPAPADPADRYAAKVHPHPGDGKPPPPPPRQVSWRGLLRAFCLVLTASAGLALMAVGMFAPAMRFWVNDILPGLPRVQSEYSVATVGTMVWQPIAGMDDAGDKLLAVLYYGLAIACPFLAGTSMAWVGLLSLVGQCCGSRHGGGVHHTWWGLASLWANLACLDVLYLSVFITVTDFGSFMGYLSTGFLCGGGGLKAGQAILWAVWVGIPGCVLLWVAQALLLWTPRYVPPAPTGPGAVVTRASTHIVEAAALEDDVEARSPTRSPPLEQNPGRPPNPGPGAVVPRASKHIVEVASLEDDVEARSPTRSPPPERS